MLDHNDTIWSWFEHESKTIFKGFVKELRRAWCIAGMGVILWACVRKIISPKQPWRFPIKELLYQPWCSEVPDVLRLRGTATRCGRISFIQGTLYDVPSLLHGSGMHRRRVFSHLHPFVATKINQSVSNFSVQINKHFLISRYKLRSVFSRKKTEIGLPISDFASMDLKVRESLAISFQPPFRKKKKNQSWRFLKFGKWSFIEI